FVVCIGAWPAVVITAIGLAPVAAIAVRAPWRASWKGRTYLVTPPAFSAFSNASVYVSRRDGVPVLDANTGPPARLNGERSLCSARRLSARKRLQSRSFEGWGGPDVDDRYT